KYGKAKPWSWRMVARIDHIGSQSQFGLQARSRGDRRRGRPPREAPRSGRRRYRRLSDDYRHRDVSIGRIALDHDERVLAPGGLGLCHGGGQIGRGGQSSVARLQYDVALLEAELSRLAVGLDTDNQQTLLARTVNVSRRSEHQTQGGQLAAAALV